ncbi:MAG: DEAD/DEAH box helicase family protein [Armatimonadetes bacterium]|nr:DEAD/DEAH box helicase family protein [Armatimonadota bacterium]
MADVVIQNPILNSPFKEPERHFRFDEDGITDEVVSQRRVSAYFIPIAQPKRKAGGQATLPANEWTAERIKENDLINRIRVRVGQWRAGGYAGVTNTTARLLEHWTNPERERRLFFCQIEAIETIIYLTEVASRFGDSWIHNELKEANDTSNPGLNRIASKLATGAGKTTVMGTLIAWHTLNKIANPQDARFSDCFLVIAPGITIRDRLRVLLPSDPSTIYKALDLVPVDLFDQLNRAKIVITNYHAFKQREKIEAPKLVKSVLGQGENSLFTETPDEMVRRVCREFGSKKNLVVLNDEAHHCYQRKPNGAIEEKLSGEEGQEAKKRDELARIWLRGIQAVKNKLGVRAIYDLSATPFFLRGSGWPEGTLFPWVVSDFSLIDAIEAGIVKVPRVPVQDNAGDGIQPTYRDLWSRIKEDLPRKGRGTEAVGGEPVPPKELEGALKSLYDNYEKSYRLWEANEEARAKGHTPPVFIVVCSNTNVSKLVYDYIAGWEKTLPSGETVIVPGALPIFSNEDAGGWASRPNTILIDSTQLESGDALSADFKKIAHLEIERFKSEYIARFPGRDADDLKDEDILREVMNTVGKVGKLGENIRCVVSVSMLTEGWDANTVTHILGVRAFGTQLLCEQVVGRGLRRRSYAATLQTVDTPQGPVEIEAFTPEYAEVYGVPFSFIPCSGSGPDPKPPVDVTRVRALDGRIACEITFPRLLGYRYEIKSSRLPYEFTEDSRMSITTRDVPTSTTNAPIVGEVSIHNLDDLKTKRPQEVAFLLAKLTLEKYFRQEPPDGVEVKPGQVQDVQAWRFPEILKIAQEWLAECVTCKDDTFPQLLLFTELAHNAADRIYRSIVGASTSEQVLKPILRPYDTFGSTRYVDFDTTKSTMQTDPGKCQISHVVGDSGWEFKLAETLETMPEVVRYVKNQNLGFTIPYTIDGAQRNYFPDFIAVIRDREDPEDLLHLIIEVTGEKKKEKEAKVETAKSLWVPAVNNHGGLGRWGFIEIQDPWETRRLIQSLLASAVRS